MSRWLPILIIFIGWLTAESCPWCEANPLMKPTVYATNADPGGKFFGQIPPTARVRRYFVAAEPDLWNFLPLGEDPVKRQPLPPHMAKNPTASKLRYVQYTDETFKARAFQPERLGVMGPVLRGVVGDYLVVTFYNRCNRPLSMHPHGVRYDKDSEGSSYFPERGLGASIGPGARFTYVWKMDETSGPRPDEPSSKGWLYHSHVMGDEEINLGLMGFIIVTDPARARPDGTPSDIDREIPALFQIFDESGISEAMEYGPAGPPPRDPSSRLPPPPPPKTWAEMAAMRELAMKHTINGFAFGNTPGLEMKEGERVRWHLFALGSETDLHTAHWHGGRVRDERGRVTDVIELLPGSMRVVDMLAENVGSWLFHCHVADHMMEGMYAPFVVHPLSRPLSAEPFFSARPQSLKFTSVQEEGGSTKVAGAFTIHDRLTLRVVTLKIMMGQQQVSFRLNNAGEGSVPGVQFKTLNAGSHGVMAGNELQFQLTLSDVWASAGRSLKNLQAPLEIHVDQVVHRWQPPAMKATSNVKEPSVPAATKKKDRNKKLGSSR